MNQKTVLPEEKKFTLLARDFSSPSVICEWIKQNIGVQPDDKLRSALEVAIEMSNQSSDIVSKKEEIEKRDREFKIEENF
jgi:hypothetical protein